MAVTATVALACLFAAANAAPPVLDIDITKTGRTFDGLGGLSGGGSTTRLLIDYPEPARSQILDYLFKPNFGASLQILKVEIGGDSQSTDGTESSHMHSADDLDYKRGYEWWLLKEAKARNPNIKTYGLPWAFPGWVGGPEMNPSPFSHPNLTSTYITKWLEGARDVYNIDIDYIGIWNERASDATYAKTLRTLLDNTGFKNTILVAKDGGADICNDLAKDPEYAKAIGVIGLHYPSDFSNYDTCHQLGKPIWASEESSSYDDLNGAACWARVVTSHYVLNQMTASIMWNLVGSYYHGTNWYASSMLTAVQPWSGFYEDDMPVVWATAHITQFTTVGDKYLVNGSGSGELPQGGYYATFADANSHDFTLTVVKISRDHASCTRPKLPDFTVAEETVTFKIADSKVSELYVWHSNFEADPAVTFEKKAPLKVGSDGTFTLSVAVGDFWTVTTKSGGQKGSFAQVPTSVPQFPLPYTDDFEHYNESSEAKYWTDQIGAWEIHPSADASGNKIMKQMVPELPIGWGDHGSNGPMTQVGMREWRDTTISAKFYIPSNVPANQSGCVGTRIDQMWNNGITFCVGGTGAWVVAYKGPALGGTWSNDKVVQQGQLKGNAAHGAWHTISLTTMDTVASGSFDGVTVFSGVAVRNIDNGFALIGGSDWFAIEFDDVHVSQAGKAWTAPRAVVAAVGTSVASANCTPNGVVDPAQAFDLRADWLLEHHASGLCVEASTATAGATLSLQKCEHGKLTQQFRNDYTRIRNGAVPVTLGAYEAISNQLALCGSTAGAATLQDHKTGVAASPSTWNTWAYFPNTNQLRNAYEANLQLGYPMCLSATP
eukprot:m.339013 g.339013  ORF g.339013 m.339013 type:complete len:833 (+) comp20573_c0_seq1:46-2544(+)